MTSLADRAMVSDVSRDPLESVSQPLGAYEQFVQFLWTRYDNMGLFPVSLIAVEKAFHEKVTANLVEETTVKPVTVPFG